MKYLKTSDIAKAAGLHSNTVRLYEEWGLLPKIPRSTAGYRLFTQDHLDQVKLVRLVFKCTLFSRDIKRTAYQVIKTSAAAGFQKALDTAVSLRNMIETECRQAEEAERFLEEWAAGEKDNTNIKGSGKAAEAISSNMAAKMLNITVDMLRDWERNNLVHIPRNPLNGYRIFGSDEINKLRVIRVLRRSKYSNMAILRAMQKLESGSSEGLREALDSPELDEERGYLCFTDSLLTALHTAKDAIDEIVRILEIKAEI
jgi:DNA-binding transcriptional MerR regulator